MKALASQIAGELKVAKHCAVYEPELDRVWPRNGKQREAQIALFAKQHGWRLRSKTVFGQSSMKIQSNLCRQ